MQEVLVELHRVSGIDDAAIDRFVSGRCGHGGKGYVQQGELPEFLPPGHFGLVFESVEGWLVGRGQEQLSFGVRERH